LRFPVEARAHGREGRFGPTLWAFAVAAAVSTFAGVVADAVRPFDAGPPYVHERPGLALPLYALLGAASAGAVALGMRLAARVRSASPHARFFASAAVAAAAAWATAPLFEGRRASAWPVAPLLPYALGAVVAAGEALTRRARERFRGATACLFAAVAATCAYLDARAFVGLYDRFHALLGAGVHVASAYAVFCACAVARTRAAPRRAAVAAAALATVAALAGASTLFDVAGRPDELALMAARTSFLWRAAAVGAADAAVSVADLADGGAVDERTDALARWEMSADEHAAVVDAAAPARPPSILIVVVDGWRADRGPGTPRGAALMPQVSAFAARGLTFERAYAPAATSWPSLRSIATGFYPDSFLRGVGEPPTLFRSLKARGYRTALYAPLPVIDRRSPYVADFDELELGLAGFAASAERFRRFSGADGPWCVWLHLGEAHAPYSPPPSAPREPGPAGDYDACLRALDAPLAELLASLPPDAYAVLTADHGEDFPFERGLSGHGAALYESAVRVPLTLLGPGAVAGVFRTPVSLTDLPSTLLGIAGDPRPPFSEGLSLLPALRGGSDSALRGRAAVFVEQRFDLEGRPVPRPSRAMVAGDRKVVASERPARVEVFDLANDPDERKPARAGDDPAVRDGLALFRRQLRRRAVRLDARLGGGALALGFDEEDERRLVAASRSSDAAARRSAARLLAARRRPQRAADLRRLAEDADPEVRAWAAVGLGLSDGDGPDWPAEAALLGPSLEARDAAMLILAERPRPQANAALAALCAEHDALEDWRPVALLVAAGDRRGLDRLFAAAAHPDPRREGLGPVLRAMGVRPRPGSPAALEAAARRFGDDADVRTLLRELAVAMPADASERVLAGLAAAGSPAERDDVGRATEELARRRAAAIGRLESGATPAAWWLGPFHAAWGLVPGVDFVRPPAGALDDDAWRPPLDEMPLRGLTRDGATVRCPPSADARFVELSFVAVEAGELEIAPEGAEPTRRPYGAGFGAVRVALPPADPTLPRVVRFRVAAGRPDRIGFREVVLLRGDRRAPR
jgi:arylsulfatase A-like enzyme